MIWLIAAVVAVLGGLFYFACEGFGMR